MTLNERQFEVLSELRFQCDDRPQGARITPMDCGGRDGSHHSATLAGLARKGLVARKKIGCWCKAGADAMFGHRCRGSYTYWITDAGRAALADYNKAATRQS